MFPVSRLTDYIWHIFDQNFVYVECAETDLIIFIVNHVFHILVFVAMQDPVHVTKYLCLFGIVLLSMNTRGCAWLFVRRCWPWTFLTYKYFLVLNQMHLRDFLSTNRVEQIVYHTIGFKHCWGRIEVTEIFYLIAASRLGYSCFVLNCIRIWGDHLTQRIEFIISCLIFNNKAAVVH